MNRRFAAVLVPLLVLPLAACGAKTGATADAAATPADPKQALVASTTGVKAGNYSFTVTSPDSIDVKGVVHIPSRSASVDMAIEEDGNKGLMQFRIVEPDRYVKMKMDLGQSAAQLKQMEQMAAENPSLKKTVAALKAMVELFSGKNWMHVDMSKLKGDDLQISIDNPDLVGVGALTDGVVTAQRTATGIGGTLDVTQVKGDDQIFGKSAFEGLAPEKAKALPYEATLDAEGRLTAFVLDVPKFADTPAGKWKVAFTGYGAASKQEAPPAAEVKEMTADGYKVLNGEQA